MVADSLAHIALHETAGDVVADAVATARRLTGADAAFAAVADERGDYPMTTFVAVTDPRWSQLRIAPGRGLGGKVLAERRACRTHDYLEETAITGDYRVVVGAEGLHGMSCVPVGGPAGVAALLYVGERRVGAPGDRAVDLLTRVADLAEVGLTLTTRRASAGPLAPASHVAPGTSSLTPRERDVLVLLCEGASNRQIADRLVIAESTAKGHVRALLDKFGARSRLEVVARARGGIV